jgi:ubiquinone/menaquinone biosynthesis C-methylase UbiE
MIVSEKRVAAMFSHVASTFDQVGPPFFLHFGRRLVELAQVPSGAAVLDVGSGRGAILLPAAEKIKPNGRVVGVDMSAGMVRELSAEVGNTSLKQVEVYQMDAEHMALSSVSFDFVLCGHSIYYFSDAFREFHRVLKSEGQVGITTFARGSLDWLWEVLDSYSSEQDSATDDEDEKQDEVVLDTPEGLEELLDQAGFANVRVKEEETDFVYADEDEWWATMWTLTFRDTMERMTPTTLERFRGDFWKKLQVFKQPDGIHIPYRVLYVLGTKFR